MAKIAALDGSGTGAGGSRGSVGSRGSAGSSVSPGPSSSPEPGSCPVEDGAGIARAARIARIERDRRVGRGGACRIEREGRIGRPASQVRAKYFRRLGPGLRRTRAGRREGQTRGDYTGGAEAGEPARDADLGRNGRWTLLQRAVQNPAGQMRNMSGGSANHPSDMAMGGPGDQAHHGKAIDRHRIRPVGRRQPPVPGGWATASGRVNHLSAILEIIR